MNRQHEQNIKDTMKQSYQIEEYRKNSIIFKIEKTEKIVK